MIVMLLRKLDHPVSLLTPAMLNVLLFEAERKQKPFPLA